MINDFDVLLFDLGKVIFDVDDSETCKYWTKVSGVEIPLSIYKQFEKEPIYIDFEKATISPNTYYEYVISHLNINISYDDFVHGLDLIYKEAYQDVAEELRKLSGKIKIISITNTNEIHSEVWPNIYKDVLKFFDKIYSSSDLHMRKPDLEIYEYVLKDLGVNADKVLYFDDREENINAAKSLGIKSYLVTSTQDVCKVLQALDK